MRREAPQQAEPLLAAHARRHVAVLQRRSNHAVDDVVVATAAAVVAHVAHLQQRGGNLRVQLGV